MIDKNKSCIILLSRLSNYITLKDACNYINIQTIDLAQLPKIEASDEFKPETHRTTKYHLQKIKYYIQNGIDKPIDIDCFCKGGTIHPIPVIIDGRHRYIAALLRRDNKIKAIFSGDESLYKYLVGDSNLRP
jgi:hypothetical protein